MSERPLLLRGSLRSAFPMLLFVVHVLAPVRSAKAAPIARDDDSRFWAKVDQRGPDECWPWTAYRTDDGYGIFKPTVDTSIRAHRWSYQRLVGAVPDGLVLDHVCRNRACVNPSHLEAVPQAENIRRGENHVAGRMQQTHCTRGHELAGDNLHVRPCGRRECLACRELRNSLRGTKVPAERAPSRACAGSSAPRRRPLPDRRGPLHRQ